MALKADILERELASLIDSGDEAEEVRGRNMSRRVLRLAVNRTSVASGK